MDLYVVMNDSFSDNQNRVTFKRVTPKCNKSIYKTKNRGQSELNSKLSDDEIAKYCILDDESKDILEKARINYQLSFRSVNKVLKVARTIADLNDNELITKRFITESKF